MKARTVGSDGSPAAGAEWAPAIACWMALSGLRTPGLVMLLELARIPLEDGDVSHVRPGVIGDRAHRPIDDVEPKPAPALPDHRVFVVRLLRSVGPERAPLIENEKATPRGRACLGASARQPPELQRPRGVLSVSVLHDVGAHLVEDEIEHVGSVGRETSNGARSVEPLADRHKGVEACGELDTFATLPSRLQSRERFR